VQIADSSAYFHFHVTGLGQNAPDHFQVSALPGQSAVQINHVEKLRPCVPKLFCHSSRVLAVHRFLFKIAFHQAHCFSIPQVNGGKNNHSVFVSSF
jgi:hypothetical protein